MSLRFIQHPEDQFPSDPLTFWLLWTAKEAIFKSKRELKTFDPKLIPVNIFKSGKKLLFSSGEVAGEIITDQDKVLAVAESTTGTISHEIFESKSEDKSKEIRQAVTSYFLKKKSLKVNVIKNGQGLPLLDYRKLPISISHHGRYITFAYPDL